MKTGWQIDDLTEEGQQTVHSLWMLNLSPEQIPVHPKAVPYLMRKYQMKPLKDGEPVLTPEEQADEMFLERVNQAANDHLLKGESK